MGLISDVEVLVADMVLKEHTEMTENPGFIGRAQRRARNKFLEGKSLEMEVVFEYLQNRFNLTRKQIKETLRSYDAAAELYSSEEWKEAAISDMWKYVFEKYSDIIHDLSPDAEVLLPGVGTARDLVFIALLRGKIKVKGLDIVEAMLEVGRQKLNWDHIKVLAKFIVKLGGGHNDWMITGLLASMRRMNVLMDIEVEKEEKLTDIDEDENDDEIDIEMELFNGPPIVDRIQKRTSFDQGDILEMHYPNEKFDLIMAIGVFPHLQKDEVIPAVTENLRVLKPGHILYFNLRADVEKGDMTNWNSEPEGRVFRDTVLGVDHSRYFNTYTEAEFKALIAEIQALYPDYTITVDEITAHHESQKPPFLNIKIEKPAA